MFIVLVTLGVLLAVAFGAAGLGKIAGVSQLAEAGVHLGFPSPIWKLIGALEVAGAIGVVIGLARKLATIGMLSTVGLVGMTIGAGYYHQRAGDGFKEWLPAVVVGSLAIFYGILRIATL